jgi:hypothetical protein
MQRIDFEKENPTFDMGEFKWYLDKYLQNYIENKQAENLPKLEALFCFVVKGKDVEDYVLIDNKQNIISAYPYTLDGKGQMEAKINILKIIKNYDDYEKNYI